MDDVDTKCTVPTSTSSVPFFFPAQMFIEPLLYARHYDKLQECKEGKTSSVPVHEPGWQAMGPSPQVRKGKGRFLDFSPHSIGLLQGLTFHLSF